MWFIYSKSNERHDGDSSASRSITSGSIEKVWSELLNPVQDPHVKNGEQISVQLLLWSPESCSVRFAEIPPFSSQHG